MNETDFALRPLDREGDRDAVARIWREVGWIEDTEGEKSLAFFLQDAGGYVATRDGAAEVCTTGHGGRMQYRDTTLPLWGITSVTTSRIARRRGLAAATTARTLADGAANGAAVAQLGIFDQGFYDRLGFGTGSYERVLGFDPATLNVPGRPSTPDRFSPDEYQAVYDGVLTAQRHHGFAWLDRPQILHAEMCATKNGFGLGRFDRDRGVFSPHLWAGAKGENGPYRIWWYVYEDDAGFLEVLRWVKSLGDQVHLVQMKEPPGFTLQDFIDRPFKQQRITHGGDFAANTVSDAYNQIRILRMEPAIAACRGTRELDIELRVTDGVERYLNDTPGWRGLGGAWHLHLGTSESEARRAASRAAAGTPVVETDIGSFSRLWYGSATARSLALQGRLCADAATVVALDEYFDLPTPHPWWDF